MIKPHLVTLSFILSHFFYYHPATDSYFQKVFSALKVYVQHASQERVFAEGIGNNYAPGNNIRFSAFVVYNGAASPLSKIVYAELINDTGKVINRIMLPVNNGVAYGNFKLPQSIEQGGYYIRAYTLWMLNFDSSLLFLKHISIQDYPAKTNIAHAADYTVEFYPEGGNLVNGLTSQVAFKATHVNGDPVNIHGIIKDTSGALFAPLNTLHDGIGRFMLHIPLPGNVYKADVISDDGIHKIFTLPKAQESGIVLHVENNFDTVTNSLHYRISRSTANMDLYQHLFLCIKANGHFTFDKVDFDSAYAGNDNDTLIYAPSPLPVDTTAEGVAQVTVFNGLTGDILAQRLLYNRNNKGIETAALKNEHGNMAITIPAAFKGAYTVSVSDGTAVNEGEGNSLAADIRLISQVRDTINNGSWYFNGYEKQRQLALDALLLTCHPNFNWQQVLKRDTVVIKYPVEQTFALTGHAYTTKKNMRVPVKGNLTLIAEAIDDSLRDVYSIPVDTTGLFVMPGLAYSGRVAVYTKNEDKRRDITVEFDKNILDSIKTVHVPAKMPIVAKENSYPPKQYRQIGDNIKPDTSHITLKPVTVRARAMSRADSIISVYVSDAFQSGASAKTYNLIDEPGSRKYSQNIIEWLQANVPGIAVETLSDGSAKPRQTIIYWRLTHGSQNPAFNRPALYIDELRWDFSSAITELAFLKVTDVALIRAYPPGTFGLAMGNSPNGAILVYTKRSKGFAFDNSTASHLSKTIKQGYAITETVPVIPDGDASNDKHTLVYWNPALHTDSTGHIFSTPISTTVAGKAVRIKVEGIAADGTLLEMDKVIRPPAQ